MGEIPNFNLLYLFIHFIYLLFYLFTLLSFHFIIYFYKRVAHKANIAVARKANVAVEPKANVFLL